MPRVLPIFDNQGNFDPLAGLRVHAIMLFPEDSRAARQFVDLLVSESDAEFGIGYTGPTDIVETIVNRAKRRRSWSTVAGYVALFMAELSDRVENLSLTKTQAAVECFLGDVDAEFKSSLPQHARDIRKHFNQFSSVAHLWATEIRFPEKYSRMVDGPANLLDFLSYSRHFEDVLRVTLGGRTIWDPWTAPPEVAFPGRPYTSEFPLKDEYVSAAKGAS